MINQQTNSVSIHYDSSNNVIQFKLKKGPHELDMDEAQKLEAIFKEIVVNPVYIIIDGTELDGHIKTEALKYFAQSPDIQNKRIMTVFVVKSLSQRLLANFYIRNLKKDKSYKVVKTLDHAFSEIKQKKKAS